MSLLWEEVVVDALDPVALGQWWVRALEWVVVNDDPEEFEIRPEPDRAPSLLFVPRPDATPTRGRLHLDFVPDDQDAEVARLLELGATHADVGQTGEEPWVVLADPEANVFCVLSAR